MEINENIELLRAIDEHLYNALEILFYSSIEPQVKHSIRLSRQAVKERIEILESDKNEA